MVRLTSAPGFRGYTSRGNRNRAVTALRKRGFNYFVFFQDVRSAYALNFGVAAWVAPGTVYINR